MNKPKLVLYSSIDVYGGYPACGRSIAKSLIELYKDKFDIKIISCGWGNLPSGFIKDNEKDWGFLSEYILTENLTYKPDIMIWHTIPTEFQAIGGYNIGWTAGIETDVCAPQWIEGINKMDLIIVPSKHAKDTFLNSQFEKKDNTTQQSLGVIKVEKPIEIIGEGFIEEIYKYLPFLDGESEIKKELDLIKEDFCFLNVGTWLNGNFSEDRKNITGLVKVFFETFKNKKNKPALILKTSIGSCSIPHREEILKRIENIRKTVNSTNLPNIYLFHGEITDQEMNELYNHSKVKAMISTTKGEGWGKPLLEFTQSKKPLIVSGWSGHLDFCNPKFTTLLPGILTPIHPSAQVKDMLIDGSKWYSIDLGHAGAIMRDYHEEYSKYKDNGKRLSYYCKENFSFSKIKEKIQEVLDANIILPYSLKLPPLLRKV